MTIGKKLYAGFGLILGILSLLFVVNIIAGWKQSSARKDSSMALDAVRAVESVRNQIMSNRLDMNNFLLSGDPRDEEKVNKGLTDIIDKIKRGEANASSEAVRTAPSSRFW
jgi:CHASE3 domain sensor protein